MNNHKKEGYLDGYMTKDAGIGGFLGGGMAAGKQVADWAIPLLLVAPALAGAGAGAIHSYATSPTKMDQETVQKAIEAAELEEFNAEIARRREQDIEEGRLSEKLKGTHGRSLHI